MNHRRDQVRAESGMTLIEVLVTVLLLTTGILVTLGVFTEMGRATYVAQRKTVMISVAQREMERLRVLPYDKVGLTGPLPAGAPARCRNATCAPEALVSGGVIAPGPERFAVQGVTGMIYRYVTWRPQACPALNLSVAGQLSNDWGQSETEIRTALGDLCPGSQHTKRITIVVVAPEIRQSFGGPVRLSTVASDPDSTLLAAGNYDGLRVDARAAVKALGAGEPPPATTTYGAMSSQTFNLTDTRCAAGLRQAPGGGHPSHDTSRDGDPAAPGLQTPPCATDRGPDLMTEEPIPGSNGDPLRDLSEEVQRKAVGGRALARDDRAGGCGADVIYTAEDAVHRRRSVHTWATAAPASGWETPTTAGRLTLTLWTQTAAAVEAPGRLCATVWRAGTGEILGTADYRLQAWPDTPTQLAVSFDLARAVVPAGERLMVTLRTPSDSAADLLLLYDHPGYQSSLTVTTRKGSELDVPGGVAG